MQEPGLIFKKLNREGVRTLVRWAEIEGWNPGPHDADIFWETDPEGFYGFYHGDRLIAGGALISYNGEFGFMGLFIVLPEFRGSGIGSKLWYLRRDLLLSRLKRDAAIGMDGVVAMQPFYSKGGFEIDFRDERYEITGFKTDVCNNVFQIEQGDFEEISAFDRTYFGFGRESFLRNWLNIPESRSYKYIENRLLKGYTVLRKVGDGYKIGPLFADNEHVAEELYKACLSAASGEKVYLDIPVKNKNAAELVKKFDAKYVFECARMYYGEPPKIDLNKIYGITTFELG
jgi:GNAT superfamily N-acetyltransferase